MKEFWVKMRFDDQKLNAALIESLLSIRASQSAINAILLDHISQYSDKSPDELGQLYATLVEQFKLEYLVDLEVDYSESKQLDLAGETTSLD